MSVLKIGDVVRLKSGGPMMTITGEYYGNHACTWFVDGKEVNGNFPEVSLYSKAEAEAEDLKAATDW